MLIVRQQCLTSNEIPIYPEDSTARFKLLMNNLIENGCYFLDNHVWLDAQTENDFNVSLTVARIIFQALEQDPTSSRMEVRRGAIRVSRKPMTNST